MFGQQNGNQSIIAINDSALYNSNLNSIEGRNKAAKKGEWKKFLADVPSIK
jgi:hypothetical protein